MQFRGVESKIQAAVVNARIKNVTKNFAIVVKEIKIAHFVGR